MTSVFTTISRSTDSIYAEYSLSRRPSRALQAAAERARWKACARSQRAPSCRSWWHVVGRPTSRQLTLEDRPALTRTLCEIRREFKERANYMIDIAPAVLADVGVEPRDGFQRFIRHEPLGVVLVLAPWNYPYLASVNAVIPAIMAGNSVILKMAQQTPLVSERYAEAFEEAGLPRGVFQYLHASHDDVARMIGDRRIAFVSFTGSVAGGHAVQQAVSKRFISANLELGGKNPAYVRPDAPLETTIENLVDGAYFNAGQSCCAVERIYVHRDLYREFVDGFVALTRQYRLGNPLRPDTTLGPMVRTSAAAFVRDQIKEAGSRCKASSIRASF